MYLTLAFTLVMKMSATILVSMTQCYSALCDVKQILERRRDEPKSFIHFFFEKQ